MEVPSQVSSQKEVEVPSPTTTVVIWRSRGSSSISDDRSQEEGGVVTEVRGGVAQEPRLPREGFRPQELANELHKEAVVLIFGVVNAKTAGLFREANTIPSDKALRAMAFVFVGPQEGTAAGVNGFLDRSG